MAQAAAQCFAFVCSSLFFSVHALSYILRLNESSEQQKHAIGGVHDCKEYFVQGE